MQTTPTDPHPKHSRSMIEEADIGSGEKTPAQLETEKMIREIPPLAGGRQGGSDAERAAPQTSGKDAAQEAVRKPENASEHDRAGHGQVQREQNASRQEAEPGMTPDAAV